MRYNEEHGIIPQTIKKDIRDLISISKANETDVAEDTPDYSSMNKTERKEAIKKLQKQMHEAAEMLDFELAAQLRDMVLELKAMDQKGKCKKMSRAQRVILTNMCLIEAVSYTHLGRV